MAKLKYPLEQVLVVKKDRVEKAERVVEEKKHALKVEEDKLTKIEEERDTVLTHHEDKLAQLRKVLDEGTTSEEVLQMKAYLKVVKEKLAQEEKKVEEQAKHVQAAEQKLQQAQIDLKQRRVEEDKIQTHKVEWEKQARLELAKEEAKEQDEIGQVLYESHRKKKKEF